MECGSRLVLLDFILILVSLLTYLLDLLGNWYLVYKQFCLRNYNFMVITAMLAIVPGLITSVLSCFWLSKSSPQSMRPKLPTFFHVFRILSIIFLNSPISGYFNALYYLLKRHQALSKGELEALQRSWDVMAVCVTEVTLLRLFFAFLHTTPQLILQLCLFEQTKIKNLKFSEGWIQIAFAFNFLISTSIAITTYDRTFRQDQPNKEALRFRATALLFCTHFFHLSARLLAIGLFASLSFEYTFLLLGIHWAVMVSWLMLPLLKSSFQMVKILSNFALGVAFIFVFIKSEGSRTRRKYAFYYTLSFVSNTAMIVMWFRRGYPKLTESLYWSPYLFLSIHYIFFILGIFLLIWYNLRCHPKRSRTEAVTLNIRLSEND